MKRQIGFCAMVGMLLAGATAYSQSEGDLGQGRAVVTVMAAHPSDTAVNVSAQAWSIKVNGKDAKVTGWTPLRSANSPVELVVLIDGGARLSVSDQFGAITNFVNEMPSGTKMAIGYMEEGRAVLGPLSSDPAQVLKGLHMPGGPAGSSGSPYFCMSDLAKKWPSQDRNARREVVMITDGVDEYSPHYNPEDPYVQTAITDSVHAGLVVYALYWQAQGRMDNTEWANNAGQNLLVQLTQATGGYSYWQGMGNPVSFDPYFQDLRIRLRNQYALTFTAPFHGKPDAVQMQLKSSVQGAKIDAPQEVWLGEGNVVGINAAH